MIRQSRRSVRGLQAGGGPAAEAQPYPIPNWLRGDGFEVQSLGARGFEDVALMAGAAIGALDLVVRRNAGWSGVWRQRLALTAGGITARQAGRTESEADLRDAVLLARPGDAASVGPAGHLLMGWRRLAERPASELLTDVSLAGLLEDFGYAHEDETVGELVDELRPLIEASGLIASLTGALTIAERFGFAPHVGYWLADALLARRLGWSHAMPLLGTEPGSGPRLGRNRRAAAASRPVGSEPDIERSRILLAAQARAALRAVDLHAELGRRADRLVAVVPKLRAKGAEGVVGKLLSEDALVASRGDRTAGMTDRSMRRLFDRLIVLGAVRELSGRPAFRIYGL